MIDPATTLVGADPRDELTAEAKQMAASPADYLLGLGIGPNEMLAVIKGRRVPCGKCKGQGFCYGYSQEPGDVRGADAYPYVCEVCEGKGLLTVRPMRAADTWSAK